MLASTGSGTLTGHNLVTRRIVTVNGFSARESHDVLAAVMYRFAIRWGVKALSPPLKISAQEETLFFFLQSRRKSCLGKKGNQIKNLMLEKKGKKCSCHGNQSISRNFPAKSRN